MAIEHFHYLGTDVSHADWIFAVVGAVAIAVIRLRKKKAPLFLAALVTAFALGGMLHVPSSCQSWLTLSAIFSFMPLDVNRSGSKRFQYKLWHALCMFPFLVFILGAEYFMGSKHLTLQSDSLTDYRNGSQSTVTKSGLSVTVFPPTNPRMGLDWRFSSSGGDVTVTEKSFFVDDSYHMYTGADLGRLIAKWGNVRPTYFQEQKSRL